MMRMKIFLIIKKNLSEEIDKLNNLLKDGVLTQEEFEKAKNKIIRRLILIINHFFPLSINCHRLKNIFFHLKDVLEYL